jgi:two-component system, sensor histidine kinase
MSYNITVIDDDKNAANFLADILKMLGHKPTVSYSPRSAIAQFNLGVPDIVFLDLNMPGANGLDVCRYLRRDVRTARLPIIVLSAHDEHEQIEGAKRAGANYYLVKPAVIEDLEKAIAHVSQLISVKKP